MTLRHESSVRKKRCMHGIRKVVTCDIRLGNSTLDTLACLMVFKSIENPDF
jgi:hypothetical protein